MTDARINPDEFLLIGTLGLPFGIRGQLKFHTVMSRPEHLRRLKTIYVGPRFQAFSLRRSVEHKQGVYILTLGEVSDRTTAETLRNLEVFLHERDAAPLAEDEYFLHDLPGLRVETAAGEELGVVKEVLETGANDVLVVTRADGGEALIPMIRDVVKSLDLANRRVVIEPLEGLLS
jgi:16S rRNA processing protein RimM